MISTVLHLTPLYSDDPDALADARDSLASNSRAAIPEWLKKHPPLAADLCAQVVSGKSRPCRRAVALKVVFIDGSGRGEGRLGELLMEQIADATATGELYPAASMAGVCTDAPWDGALSAFWYARDCGFGIAPGMDVRWSVRVLPRGRNWDMHEDELCLPKILTGRSAGVAFFLGLFALAQAEGALGGWKAREVVERMVALATLPDTEARATVDPLGTLGGEETKKLAVLDALPAGTRVVVVFPAAFTGSIHGRHESLAVTTVGELAGALRERCADATRPDSLPASRHASFYIGGNDEVRLLTELLRKGGLHVVTGSGGVGKTARVVEASAPLWKEGVFPGGRFWIDLYGARESGRTSDVLAAERIVKTCGEIPAEKLDDLRAQARDLLARHPSFIFLEGAETVAEGDIASLLELFPEPTTVVWMTRRETDAQHACLRSAAHHPVRALSPADALEMLCYAAGFKMEELPATERADWEEIAKATEHLPLLLGWAGEALRPDRGTNVAEYLAELRADPLGEIADPNARERNNAGRFLRRSLARIAPTAEMPDLPTVAERLFASLAAFHPNHGAPLAWWPLAAGLDAAKSEGRRRLAAARRALLGLGLVNAQIPPRGAEATAESLHAVHALAGGVATDLWRRQPAEQRFGALSSLFHAAITSLNQPLPQQWFYDSVWVAGRTAEAAHYRHWIGEFQDDVFGDPDYESDELKAIVQNLPEIALLDAWLDFLRKHVDPYPLLDLKDTAWNVVSRHLEWLCSVYPENPTSRVILVESLSEVGYLCNLRDDFAGAETVFNRGMAVAQALVDEDPSDPNFQDMLAVAHGRIGDTYGDREDWDAAERAYKRGIEISRKLVKKHAAVPEFRTRLAAFWGRVGAIRAARGALAGAKAAFKKEKTIKEGLPERQPALEDALIRQFEWSNRLGQLAMGQEDWDGAGTAFTQAIEIGRKLIEANPHNPDHRQEVAGCWGQIGHAREGQQDLERAEQAFYHSLDLHRILATEFPDRPNYMRDLACAWNDLSKVCKARQDFVRAEEALTHALKIDEKLTAAYSDVQKFVRDLAASWFRLAELREARDDLAGAEEALNHALKIDKKLAEDHPDGPDFQETLGLTLTALGKLYVQRQHWADAEVALTKSQEIYTKLVAEHPEVTQFQGGLSVTWCYLASMRKKLQDWAGAETACKTAIGLDEKAAVSHPDLDFRPTLSTLWVELGDVRAKQNDWAGAEVAFKNALAIDASRVVECPKTRDLQRCLAVVWERLGDVRTEQQDWLGAEVAFKNEIEIGLKLVSEYPDVLDFHGILDSAWRDLGKVCIERQDWVGAETAFRNAIEVDKNAAAAHPDAAEPQFYLGFSWDGLGIVAGKRGDDAGEEQALIESLHVCEAVADRWLKTARFEDRAIYQALRLAQALCRRGREEEAASLARRGLARAERLAALLQETGAEMTERQKQMIARLAKLLGPEADSAGQ